jgi:hypothetical protein
VLALAACGASSGQKVKIEATPVALRKAAETTLAKGTSKVAFTMSMSIQGQDITLSGTGQLDPANKRFEMSFDAKELFNQLAASSSLSPNEAASFDKPIDVIIDGTVMYMHFPLFAQLGGGDKEFVKFDLAAAGNGVGDVLGGGVGGAFGSDPSSFLQFLEGAGKVTEVGSEDVDGVSTTHFSGSYTLADALAQLPADRRDKVEKSFEGLGLTADAEAQEIPFEVWIDGDGLVRKMTTSLDMSKLASSSPNPLGATTMTMKFSDFGAPVDIQIPQDDQVQDFSSVFGSKFSTVASSIN